MGDRFRRMRDYRPFATRLVEKLSRSYSFECDPPFEQVIAENPQLIHIIKHGRLLSWVFSEHVKILLMCQHGGDDRIPRGVVHRLVYKIPLLDRIPPYVNSFKPESWEEIVTDIRAGRFNDIGILPEGDYCNFGDGVDMQPFRSYRFVEIALQAGCPLLLNVHIGTEAWGANIPLGPFAQRVAKQVSFLRRGIERFGGDLPLSVQLWPSRPIDFRLKMQLYHPSICYADLSADPLQRREQLAREGEAIRSAMQIMLDQLKCGPRT